MRRVVRRSLARSLCTSIRGTPYAELSIGVPKETAALERRVSQTPETVGKLVKEGFTVRVESGAARPRVSATRRTLKPAHSSQTAQARSRRRW